MLETRKGIKGNDERAMEWCGDMWPVGRGRLAIG